ncbi:MAG TPA: hypothetical protein VKE70_13480 [Candidatus Solibacter sp.]|nr:hypothetical protein [Candidatus Solibacter sp.]
MNRLNLALCLCALPAILYADGNRGFTATLNNCTELIGFGPVPYAAARTLVPSSYTLVPFGPNTAGLVVRASLCDAVGVGGSAEKPAIVAQVGIAIASPDGTGDINNYTLLYSTNHEHLSEALNEAGLPAVFDRALAYEFTPSGSGQGEVYVAVSPVVQPAWFLSGTADPPPSGGAPVVANWWSSGSRGVVKMATSIPSISYGAAGFSLHTSKNGLLGGLIGGNTDAAFVFFNARGVFATALLTVTAK